MTSPVLFSTGASPAATTSRNLVEFKAGKMELRDKLVHPIKRQGLVYLRQSPDDNLMHFCWKDRQSGVIEDDLILFPDDCEFKRVNECTTGRVYVLKMKSSNKKMFFWMQESRTDRDDDFCKKINEMLNNPPRGGSDLGSGGSGSDRDLQALFGNMTQDQVAQLLSTNGVNLSSLLNSGRSPSSNSGTSASSTASTTNSSAPTSATSSGGTGTANASAAALAAAAAAASNASGTNTELAPGVNLNEFRALISGALMEGNEDEANALMQATLASSRAESGGPGAASGASQNRDPNSSLLIDLSTAMNSESLAHLLNDREFLRQIEPHLPPVHAQSTASSLTDQQRSDQFSDTIRSSQFRSSLSQFCVALQSGQLGPLMSQFGLNQACVEAADMGNLEAFVRALESQTRQAPPSASDTSASSGQQPPGDNQDKS